MRAARHSDRIIGGGGAAGNLAARDPVATARCPTGIQFREFATVPFSPAYRTVTMCFGAGLDPLACGYD